MREEAVDLRAVADPGIPAQLPGGDALIAFTDALLGAGGAALLQARRRLAGLLGDDAAVAAAAIAANFSRNDRIANATGIPLEPMFVEQSVDFRSALGIDAFVSAVNTLGEVEATGCNR